MALATLLTVGAKGQTVTALQAQLKARGFDPGPVDGDFGPGTEQAVRAFQQAHGLEVDGIVGVQTASALGLSTTGGDLPPADLPPADLVALGHVAEDRFGLHVGECSAPGAPARWGPVAPVHATKSLHYDGRAFDAGGSASAMAEFAAWVTEHYTGSVAELIHNPTGSVKNGQQVDPGFWGSATWAAHANHIHLAL